MAHDCGKPATALSEELPSGPPPQDVPSACNESGRVTGSVPRPTDVGHHAPARVYWLSSRSMTDEPIEPCQCPDCRARVPRLVLVNVGENDRDLFVLAETVDVPGGRSE